MRRKVRTKYLLFILIMILFPVLLFSQKNLETAKMKFENEKYVEAIEILEKLIQTNEDNWEYYHWLGISYLENTKLPGTGMIKAMKIFKKAKKNLIKAVELNSEDIVAHEQLAYSYYYPPKIAGGNKKKALEHLEEIKKRDSKKGLEISIEFFLFDKEYEKAEQKCKMFINLYPDDPDVYHHLGMIYQQKEDFQKAFDEFEKIIKKDSTALNSLYQIGRTTIFSGQNLDRGVECMKSFLQSESNENNPPIDAAHWRLGMIYEKQGKLDLAEAEFKEAIKLNPDDKDYKKSLKKLRKKL
ncbi:MAG: tetratricopeptide repeat protein [Candidatus Cloacimonetes bacterium]|nr:tetratricopeptide repeat protein [Candidatus Cloacimonadota bacterium]